MGYMSVKDENFPRSLGVLRGQRPLITLQLVVSFQGPAFPTEHQLKFCSDFSAGNELRLVYLSGWALVSEGLALKRWHSDG